MTFKRGDKVRFLNDVGDGVVTKTTSNGDVFVLDSSGFEIPVRPEELLLISAAVETTRPQVSGSDEPEMVETEPEFYPEVEEVKGNDQPRLFLALVPQEADDITDADIDLYLINDCNYIAFYNLIEEGKNQSVGKDAGIVEANTKVYIQTIEKKHVGSVPDFRVQATFYRQGYYKPVAPVDRTFKVKPTKLFQKETFKENDFFHSKAILFEITGIEKSPSVPEEIEPTGANDERKKLKELERMLNTKAKNDLGKQPQIEVKKKEEKREIDLHIHELIDDTTGLSNNEMLEVQIDRFQREMKQAIKDQLKRIVFIHGIGNGTLKNTLRKELETNYSKYTFYDASYKEYGFGATLVVLRN